MVRFKNRHSLLKINLNCLKMKTKKLGIIGLGIALGLTFGNFETKAQSLESQLKIIGGDLLSNSQNKLARTIGKGLSTSGAMQYEIERAQAGRNQISIEQNNFPMEYLILSEDGKYFPAQGYEWANPSNTEDFRLRKAGSLESRAILPAFNKERLITEWNNLAKSKFITTGRDNNTGIGTVFTCNWYKDFNGNGFTFDEFEGIKRTFNKNEKIEIVALYGTNFGEVRKKWSPIEEVLTFSLYRGEDGKFLGEEKRKLNPFRTKIVWRNNRVMIESATINPGNLNPGRYFYNIKLEFPNNSKKTFNFPRSKSGEFEIIK